jgi:O-antigen/teichoic acid export membrane protein
MALQMKINNKEFFKLSFLYTVVAAFPPLLNLIIRPLIEGPNKLHASDFSQIEIAETITTFAFIFATFSMGNAISRFYYDYVDNKKGYNKLVSSIFNSILLRGAIVLVIAFFARDIIGSLFTQDVLRNFSTYGFASIIVGINRAVIFTAFALFRNEKKVRLYLGFSILLGIVRTGMQYAGIMYYDMSFIGYVYGSSIGSGVIAISILVYTYYKTGFHFDLKTLKPVNKFATPLFEYGIIAWGITFADRYFLESKPAALGIYSQALLLGNGIEIILQGIRGASQPEIFRLMKDGIVKNMEEIKKLSHLLMAQSQFFIGIAIIPAMVYCLMFKTNLQLAAGFIVIVFAKYILRSQMLIFSFPIYFEKKTQFFLYFNLLILIANLALLYVLVPVMGIYGAVTAVISSQLLQVIGTYYYQNKVVAINWNLKKILFFPFGIILIIILLEIVKATMGINQFITASIAVFTIFTSLALLYKVELKKLVLMLKKSF